MIAQLAQPTYTPAEYLTLEEQAEQRHELINGEMIPMAGGTTNHNLVTGNLYLCLRLALKSKNFFVFIENVRLFVELHEMFTYPDVMVITGAVDYYGNTQTTVTNPSLIIEVLSPSTRNYDQGQKFEFYRSLSSLREYVLVDPERVYVMVYGQQGDGSWRLSILEDLAGELVLDSLGVKLAIAEVYEGIFASA